MLALTLAAFEAVGISVSRIADHVAFSVEQSAGASVAKDIETPCVSLCQLNSELCVSCGRTWEEIRKWRGMKRPEKIAAVQKAAARMKAIAKRRAHLLSPQ